MSASQGGVLVVWLVTITALFVLVFSAAPAMARTLFRERLDAIVDDCQDALLDGTLTLNAAVQEFLTTMQVQKRVARQITLLRVGLIVTALHRINTDFRAHHGPSFADLRPDERKTLHTMMKRANRALASYLVWGSPLGWISSPLVYLGSKASTPRRHHHRPPLDVDRVAEEFNSAGVVGELRGRTRLLQRAA